MGGLFQVVFNHIQQDDSIPTKKPQNDSLLAQVLVSFFARILLLLCLPLTYCSHYFDRYFVLLKLLYNCMMSFNDTTKVVCLCSFMHNPFVSSFRCWMFFASTNVLCVLLVHWGNCSRLWKAVVHLPTWNW